MRSRSDLSRLAAALGGLPILGLLEGSPAAEAGMLYGDILLAIDGLLTSTWDDFLRARSKTRESFVARVFREGNELEMTITLRSTPRSPFEIIGEVVGRDVLGTQPLGPEADGTSERDNDDDFD